MEIGDEDEKVHLVCALGGLLLDHPLKDTAAFVISVVESLGCPAEEAFIFLVENMKFCDGILTKKYQDMADEDGLVLVGSESQ